MVLLASTVNCIFFLSLTLEKTSGRLFQSHHWALARTRSAALDCEILLHGTVSEEENLHNLKKGNSTPTARAISIFTHNFSGNIPVDTIYINSYELFTTQAEGQVLPTLSRPHGSPAGRGICGVGTFSCKGTRRKTLLKKKKKNSQNGFSRQVLGCKETFLQRKAQGIILFQTRGLGIRLSIARRRRRCWGWFLG